MTHNRRLAACSHPRDKARRRQLLWGYFPANWLASRNGSAKRHCSANGRLHAMEELHSPIHRHSSRGIAGKDAISNVYLTGEANDRFKTTVRSG